MTSKTTATRAGSRVGSAANLGSRPDTSDGRSERRPQTTGDISSYAPPGIKLNGPQAEEMEELIRHYDTLIEQRENQVALLTVQLESEQRRAAMLESELSLALAAMSRAEAAHAEELAKVEGDVARVLAERRGLLEKLQGIEVVEDAVREMVVQMKNRVGDDELPSPDQLQAEKEALKTENILTVLGSLRATLKSLWTFKVEAEEDLRCSRTGRQQQHGQQVLSLKAQIREMEAAVRAAQAEQAAAQALAQQETAAREAVLAESQAALATMEGQQREVLAALRGATEEAAAARRALAAAQEEGRRRDGLVLKNQQLESARHFDRVAQDRELRLMQTAHTKQIYSMQSELTKISDLMLQNDQLRDRLRQAVAARDALAMRTRQLEAAADLAVRQQRAAPRFSAADDASLAPTSPNGGGPHPAAIAWSRAPSINSAGPSRAQGGPGAGPGGARVGLGAARPATASALMASRRATAAAEAKAAAEEQEEQDPIYQTLANVGKLHRGIKSSIREMKRDLADAAPSWAKQGAGGGGGAGPGGTVPPTPSAR
ncbi:hypothetical protein HYH03_000017 [Edaphochlamys debaryana]|uniref:Uncharacterized protein n=1 Tax=Edaphochlamys debaryana TaxID=47281 RepID=A0A835YES4_9CHLO|nr:hypothetical protein HYH03_000017 [Edaphochlamys debaryana]|eukprot:KAG2501510.1 hypothetical protein HYH03_000017 [Edaphochlamys debaryana]